MEIEKETILLMSKGDKKAYETMFRRFYPNCSHALEKRR